MLFNSVAYAAGSESNSDEDVTECSVNAAVSDQSTAGTDTGRDKLQFLNDSADNASHITVVCPSGEAVDTVGAGHGSHKCSSMFKSSSMPLMSSLPPAVTQIDRRSLDSELRYLSTYAKLRRFTSSPLENSKNSQIAKSPYMSPLLASDEMLLQLCPVHLIVCIIFCVCVLLMSIIIQCTLYSVCYL